MTSRSSGFPAAGDPRRIPRAKSRSATRRVASRRAAEPRSVGPMRAPRRGDAVEIVRKAPQPIRQAGSDPIGAEEIHRGVHAESSFPLGRSAADDKDAGAKWNRAITGSPRPAPDRMPRSRVRIRADCRSPACLRQYRSGVKVKIAEEVNTHSLPSNRRRDAAVLESVCF